MHSGTMYQWSLKESCYINSVLMYCCESWTITEEIKRRIEAFEMWCYRRILKISWRDRITNVEVLRRVGETETKIYRNICRRKLKFAGHVLKGSSGEAKKNRLRPPIMWCKSTYCTFCKIDTILMLILNFNTMANGHNKTVCDLPAAQTDQLLLWSAAL